MKKLVVMILMNFMVLHMPARQEGGTGRITGKITDKATKEAVFGAQVLLLQNGLRKGVAITDTAGIYWIRSLGHGMYLLRVNYPGCYKDSMNIEIKDGMTLRQNLHLRVDTAWNNVIIHSNVRTIDN